MALFNIQKGSDMHIREKFIKPHIKAEYKIKETHITSDDKNGDGVKKIIFREYPQSFCEIEVDGELWSLGYNQWIFIQLMIEALKKGIQWLDGRKTVDRIGCEALYPFQVFQHKKIGLYKKLFKHGNTGYYALNIE